MFEIIYMYTSGNTVFRDSRRFKSEEEALGAIQMLLAIKTVVSATLIKNGEAKQILPK